MVIIVVTFKGSPWLQECLDSLAECVHPVHICWSHDEAYDAEGLYYAERHGITEYVLLHDSMIVKDQSIFDLVQEYEEPVKIASMMFLGKFISPDLPKKPRSKRQAIDMEREWYSKQKWKLLCPELIDNSAREFKHGRENMVLENQYIKKFKGTWQ